MANGVSRMNIALDGAKYLEEVLETGKTSDGVLIDEVVGGRAHLGELLESNRRRRQETAVEIAEAVRALAGAE